MSFCSLTIKLSSGYWVAGSFPCLFWPCFVVTSSPHGCVGVCVCVCDVGFSWPWSNTGSCYCQLLAQLHSTFIAFSCRARGLRARTRTTLVASCFSLAASPYLTHLHRWSKPILGNTATDTSHGAGQRDAENLVSPFLLLDESGCETDGGGGNWNGMEPKMSRCCGHLCLTCSSSSPSQTSSTHTETPRDEREGGLPLVHLSSWKATVNESNSVCCVLQHSDLYTVCS